MSPDDEPDLDYGINLPYERKPDVEATEEYRRKLRREAGARVTRDPPRYLHGRAFAVAEQIRASLLLSCERIEIAGSIRRQQPHVKDIEIVAIPKVRVDLFGEPMDGEQNELDLRIMDLIAEGSLEPRIDRNGRPRMGQRYKALRAVRTGLPLDLFAVLAPAQWGAIFAIRTGPADFSRRLVTECQRHDLRCEGGRLITGASKTVPTPTEADFFRECGVAMREPRDR